jgi:type III secretion system FlhB-like substrate exporter
MYASAPPPSFGMQSGALQMASQFGGSVHMLSGAGYRSRAYARKNAIKNDVATAVRIVSRFIAAWLGSPTVTVKEDPAQAQNAATVDNLAAAVKALSEQLAATDTRGQYRELIIEGLGWIAGKVVEWATESDDAIEQNASYYDMLQSRAMSMAGGQGPQPMFGSGGRRSNGVNGKMVVGPTAPDGSFVISFGE